MVKSFDKLGQIIVFLDYAVKALFLPQKLLNSRVDMLGRFIHFVKGFGLVILQAYSGQVLFNVGFPGGFRVLLVEQVDRFVVENVLLIVFGFGGLLFAVMGR